MSMAQKVEDFEYTKKEKWIIKWALSQKTYFCSAIIIVTSLPVIMIGILSITQSEDLARISLNTSGWIAVIAGGYQLGFGLWIKTTAQIIRKMHLKSLKN